MRIATSVLVLFTMSSRVPAQEHSGWARVDPDPGSGKAATKQPKPPPGNNNAFGTNSWLEGAFRGQIYFLKTGTQRLPDLTLLTPLPIPVYVQQLNVPARTWQSGFPGVSKRFEWFAIEYEGIVRASREGRYNLRIISDDGSKVYVDDKLIVNNDGLHGPVSAAGKVELDTQPHKIRVQYFQGPRYYVALRLFCSSPPEAEQLFPNCGLKLETPDKPHPTKSNP